jgi:hypothetical protein
VTAIAFDTLAASRTLRDAGADERLADALVRVVSQTVELPSIEHLATKADVATLTARIDGLDARVSTLQTILIAGVGLNLTGLIAIAGLVFAVLRQAG